MRLDVHCTVNNCHYWKAGNQCDANQILITSDRLADQAPDRIDATQASTLQQTPAGTCMETCCKTFVDNASNKKNADGVQRM